MTTNEQILALWRQIRKTESIYGREKALSLRKEWRILHQEQIDDMCLLKIEIPPISPKIQSSPYGKRNDLLKNT